MDASVKMKLNLLKENSLIVSVLNLLHFEMFISYVESDLNSLQVLELQNHEAIHLSI